MKSANPLGQQIRELRKQRAWTQSQLADVAGVSTRTVQRLEARGAAAPETLMAVANAFDLDVGELTRHQNTNHQSVIMEIPNNPDFSRKALLWGGGLYAALVAGVVVVTFLFFPADSYPLWVGGEENFSAVQYRKFIQTSALVLAMVLGFWSAFYGAVSKKWIFGVLALGAGLVLSLAVYSLLPWLKFPNDQYSPGAIWLFTGLVPLVLAWSLVNAGFLVMKKL